MCVEMVSTREDEDLSREFKLGDKVKWTSQSQGYVKTKIGVIVEVVKPGSDPDRERFESLYKGAGVGYPRWHESYVVELDQVGKRKPKYYWPRVSALEVA